MCLQQQWWWLFQAENKRSADLPCVNSFAQLLCLRTNPKNSVQTFFPPPSFLMQTDRQVQAFYKSTHRSSDLLVYPQFSGPMKASVEANEGTGQFFFHGWVYICQLVRRNHPNQKYFVIAFLPHFYVSWRIIIILCLWGLTAQNALMHYT